MTSFKDITENIKVYLRQRPFLFDNNNKNEKRQDQTSGIKEISGNNLSCTYYSAVNKTSQEFKMDYIFDATFDQNNLYDKIARPIVESALMGYSGTIFAYGPTSSGKTFTMRGNGDNSSKGIMPR